ncbi:Magnesium and cobalt efflux protein CorC [Halioglobus japonicus]|nr:Magnesium and cobalt efflux protein CorC [Halioglobus japonicus]
MSEDRNGNDNTDRSWIDKITLLFSSEPRTRRDLEDVLTVAVENEIIDQDAHSIMEGAMQVSDMQARDIMIPRSQMVIIKADGTLEDTLPHIIRSAHSRYPVIGDSPDVILGILLAKDLLPQILNLDNGNFKIEDLLRPAMVVPESKRLNVLLREFRENRNHMAIVIDEYGGVAGLITIEDVLEEIVGEIEDETDAQVDRHIHMIDTNEFMVKALTPIEEFNTYFDSNFSDDDFDTIGGLVIQAFGHMPSRNEVTTIDGFRFEVIKADQRKIYSLRLQRQRN